MTINGTMKEFEPKDLVNKVKERRESLHTNRTWGKDLYVISVDAFGTVEKPESVYVDIIKIMGSKQERLHLEKFNTWEEAEKFLEEFKQEVISKEPKELELSHLKEVIKKLNSPSTIDGEEYESLFDFDYRIEENKLYIYDKNEAYSINYLEEKQGNLYEAWEEFGKPKGQPKPDLSHVVDEVHEQLKKAVKEDLGENSILEWENNVVMVVGIPDSKFEDSCVFLKNDLSKKHEKVNMPKTNTTAVSDEKFDYDKFLVKNHLGEHEYGLAKEDFEDYPEDYDNYPKSEWISRSEWEEFKNKSEDTYWYSWEMLIDQYLDGQANTTEEAIELAKQHPEDLKIKDSEKHKVKLVSYTQFDNGEIQKDDEEFEEEFDSLDLAEKWADEVTWGLQGHFIKIYIDDKLWGDYVA